MKPQDVLIVDDAEIGRRVRSARKAAGLTQQTLGKMMGLDQPEVARIELGQRRLTTINLREVCRATGERYDFFLRDKDDPDVFKHLREAATTEPERAAVRDLEHFVLDYEFLLALT